MLPVLFFLINYNNNDKKSLLRCELVSFLAFLRPFAHLHLLWCYESLVIWVRYMHLITPVIWPPSKKDQPPAVLQTNSLSWNNYNTFVYYGWHTHKVGVLMPDTRPPNDTLERSKTSLFGIPSTDSPVNISLLLKMKS